MENTSLVALSRQLVLRQQLDVIANNVANINTSGFKRQSQELVEYEMPVARAMTFPRADRVHSFVDDWKITTSYEQGEVEETGNTFDLAISGEGFFAVNTPEGERYTRAGNFLLDRTGKLVTPDGFAVQGEGGDIVFGRNESGIVISQDGTISSSAGVKGRLKLMTFADSGTLEHVGLNFYAGDGGVVGNVKVVQGSLEQSNVRGVVEMSRLIETNRSYEQITRMMKDHDELRLKAIDRLAEVRA